MTLAKVTWLEAPASTLEWMDEMPCAATISLQRDPQITGSHLQEERAEDWVVGGWGGEEGGPQAHRVLGEAQEGRGGVPGTPEGPCLPGVGGG